MNTAGSEVSHMVLNKFDTDDKPIMQRKIKYTSKGKVPEKKYQTPNGEIEFSKQRWRVVASDVWCIGETLTIARY